MGDDLMATGPRPGPRLVESVHELARSAAQAFDMSGAEEVEVWWTHPADTISESDETIHMTIRRTQPQRP